VVCIEFWLGLAVRYRLPRRKRVESASLEFVRNLLLGRPLRLDHLLFPLNPADCRRMAWVAASGGIRDLPLTVAGLALDGIDFTTWLHWLHNDRIARSTAGRAGVLLDLWRHIEPFMRPERRPYGTVKSRYTSNFCADRDHGRQRNGPGAGLGAPGPSPRCAHPSASLLSTKRPRSVPAIRLYIVSD
jgi:hypothetical protein